MSVDEYRPPPPTVPPDAAVADPQPQRHEPNATPRPVLRKLGPRSLTSRLVVGVVSLVIVLVALVGTATFFSLRSFLGDRLDQQLQTTAGGANRIFGQRSSVYGPTPQEIYAVALDPDTGEVLSFPSGESVVALKLSAAERAHIAQRNTASPATVETTDGVEVRITERPGQVTSPVGAQFPATVVIGLSTGEEHKTLSRLFYLELLIGGAAVIVALITTSLGVRFSLRRLREVTATAQDVAAELSPEGRGLDRRVPVTDEGTEVGQLAESMNTLLSAVETQFAARLESERRMRQFLADASHELRTPLTSIRGYAELAQLQRAKGDTAEDNLARIESEGTRMSRLVEDLLLLARGDSEGESPTPELIDVTDLLDDAVSGARAAFPERDVGIELVGDPHVVGDRDQLIRVVRNLVANAAVHTRRDRPIRVRGFADDNGVTIQVVDGGPGLPPEQAAHVFERFWRADKARTRARGGSGLGLSIVAAVVRAHGGSVRFDSTVENGSTVTVWLPRAHSL